MKKNFQNIAKSILSLPQKLHEIGIKFVNDCRLAKKKLENFVQTNYNLGIYHIDRCNMTDAKMRFFMVTKLDPTFTLAHYHLARCHLFNLDFDKARSELQIALSLDKKLKAASYRLKLLNKEIENEPIPLQVIEEDYNNLADKYEDYIENQQKHNVAEILSKLIAKHMEGIVEPFVIDLGCGTGIMGLYLRSVVSIKSLLGIDYSVRMLDLAKELAIDEHLVYNHTRKLDYCNLHNIVDKYDVITACMSFIYANELNKVFESIEKVSAKRTLLGLVLLKSTKNDIEFDYKNGCYSFGLKYLESIFKKFDWTVIEQKDIKLFSNGTHGLVFVLKK